ncbi:DEAD/DEAH box helicase [Lutimonas zeaxanthinifaciens]|uniref:DEAD/DEAH box helicase n=1 Tax=Lutimonas zeaxanthinifaciens TaxID=3060215 RepID=UPI00265D4577|nr:DEAD/DEAH box helicase [Lutimonas sp. YSD2104]WKK65134.1 DEAD/DEAH box helicase [Lutimonas sp. YSD2104]
MKSFEDLKIRKPQLKALSDMGISSPTPIQEKSIPAVNSGNDMVGLAQTGTGKTLAYLLPILTSLPYSDQTHPRVLILVPTRELVSQVVKVARELTSYQNVRIEGVYGGANINTQKEMISQGLDVLIATPGRLFDLAVSGVLRLSSIQKLILDEVDEMLFEGFRPQLLNIFDILPRKKQSIMFSATLTEEVDELIQNFFKSPKKIEIVPVGTPLERITQKGIPVPNYNTKVNFLRFLVNQEGFDKVLVFTKNKRIADRLYADLQEEFENEMDLIHSNKSQNYRFQAVEKFENGTIRLLIATDIVSRGMDILGVSHVINFDAPKYPEQYIHRIGRTGRARESGEAIFMFTSSEEEMLLEIEILMQTEVPIDKLPLEVEISKKLMPEEIDRSSEKEIGRNQKVTHTPGPAFHEKSDKNKKVNLGGSYKREIKKKYKKPKTRPPKTKGKK